MAEHGEISRDAPQNEAVDAPGPDRRTSRERAWRVPQLPVAPAPIVREEVDDDLGRVRLDNPQLEGVRRRIIDLIAPVPAPSARSTTKRLDRLGRDIDKLVPISYAEDGERRAHPEG